LHDLRTVLVLEIPRNETGYVHRGAVHGSGHFLARHHEKVLADLPLEFDRLWIDELVMLAENNEVITMIMVPLGDDLGRGIGMPAKLGMAMGIPLEPLVGKSKRRQKKEQRI
jgi:hypothetical protein